MTAGLTADQLNSRLIEIDETAGFEVQFSGLEFIARNQYGKQVRGTLSATPLANAQALARVINTLRWPVGPRAEDPQTKVAQQLQLSAPRPDLPTGITYEPMWITPEQAEGFLLAIGGVVVDGRPVQRPLSMDTARKYAKLMAGGGWGLSPDPYAFDKKGLGLNGQHRWAAQVYTGLTLPFMVSHGWEGLEAFAYLDKQLKRTGITTLALKGYANAKDLHAAALLLGKAEKERNVSTWTTKLRLNETEMLQVVEDRPMLQDAVKWAASGTQQFMHRTALAVARAMAAEQCGEIDLETGKPVGDWDATSKFFEGLKRGGGINDGDPAFAIRSYLSTTGKNPRLADSREVDKAGFQLFLFIGQGWNKWVQRERVDRPSYKVGSIVIPEALRPRV